eukprot:1757102-Prorocentrum_lima.AAC.1
MASCQAAPTQIKANTPDPKGTQRSQPKQVRDEVLELSKESQDMLKMSQQQETTFRTSVEGIESAPVTSKGVANSK